MIKKCLLLLIFSLLGIATINAQLTDIYTEADRPYKTAMELFTKEKYGAAKQLLDQYIIASNGSEQNKINAEFYAAICAFELFHPDAEYRLKKFTTNHPENFKANRAWFYLGRYYYRTKEYRNALPALEKTDATALVGDETSEYYFKMGYCYFSKNDNEKAAKNFNQILNVDSKYQTAAQYYYGHIAYSNDNYKTALEYFSKLDSSATFGPMVPYYITQMYFDQRKYDSVISYAVPVLEKSTPNNANEITRIVAESYYRKADYKNSLVYFKNYESGKPVLSRDDYYSIGYCEYRNEEYSNAIESFLKVISSEDTLSQNAYFHLADCYLNTKNKQSARNAFLSASKMEYSKSIQEAAKFNYAKLSYELNFQPVAINSFRDFNKEFPESKYIDESNELLASLYLTTRNYKDALAALENIKTKGPRAKEAYQKVAFYRGVEFFNDGDKDKAISMFEKAIVNDADQNIKSLGMYWKAEALYNQNKYEAALKQYRIFIFNPGSINTSIYNLGNYNIAYCYFKQNNYADAQTWFRKFLSKKEEDKTTQYNDALVRTGDCYYVARNFDEALNYYSQAISNNAASSDYCFLQKGIIQGIQGDLTAKNTTLQAMISKYPNSKFKSDVIYEKGKAQMALGNNSEAKSLFNQLLKDYPNSPYLKKAQLNIGLLYYNEKQDEQALDNFKKVISQYPGTPEATEALTTVKNIYVSNGKPDDYFSYVKTIPNSSVSIGAQDSITYEAAEQRYLKGNFNDAAKDFNKYLQQFPNGAYQLNATFYKSECEFRNGNFAEALKGYEKIGEQPRNIFSEKSLAKSAAINFKNKNYEVAQTQYEKLEQTADLRDNILASQLGLMRTNYFGGRYDQAITYAQKLIASEKLPVEVASEAHLIYGRSAIQTNDYVAAKKEFTLVAKQSSAGGAESKYNLAYIEYKLSNYKASQNKCFEVINQVPSYDFWIAKSFLLLSDNYLALKDTFQAKHTLQSLLDNYEKSPDDAEDLKQEAQKRYDELVAIEQAAIKKPEEQPDPELNINEKPKDNQ